MAVKPMTLLPDSAEELVKRLDAIYPERTPTPDLSERELWMRAGERRLVRRLLEIKQNTDNRKEP